MDALSIISLMQSFQDIIDAFPSRRHLAEKMGVQVEAVQKWRQRNSIPPEYDLRLVDAASAAEISLGLEDIARLRCASADAA